MGKHTTTLIILYLAARLLPPLLDWALVHAVWSPDRAAACREADSTGACWAFVADKYHFILFGTFPADEQWRPALVITILLALYGISGFQLVRRAKLAGLWLGGLILIGLLMWGGIFGLTYVENERWGGLTLTLLLSTFGIALAFPTVDSFGPRAALRDAAHSLVLHRLYRSDSRRAVDLGAVHGLGHAAAYSYRREFPSISFCALSWR